MQNKSHQLILSLLAEFPEELGTIQERFETGDPRFIVIYEDDPASAGVRFSIASSLLKLQKANAIQLVGSEGASGSVDTSLIFAFPMAEVRLKTAEFLVKELKLSSVEFCEILLEGKFPCHGVEDPELYQQALKLFREGDHNAVNMLGHKRAPVLVENLLGLMLDHQVHTAALPVCGNLPQLVCAELKRLELSYAWIKPNPSGSRDWERYVSVIGGDSMRQAAALTALSYALNEETEGSESWLPKEVPVRTDLCLFCNAQCEAPYLRLSDGGLVGFKCLIACLEGEPTRVSPNDEVVDPTERLCFVCHGPPDRAYFNAAIGSLCLSCAKSGLDTLKKVVNAPAAGSNQNEFSIPRFIPWIYVDKENVDRQPQTEDSSKPVRPEVPPLLRYSVTGVIGLCLCWLFRKVGLYRAGLRLVSFALKTLRVRDAALFLVELAVVERGRGNLTKANLHRREAIQTWEKAFGPNSLEMGAYLNNLLRLLQEEGHHQEALPLCRRALEIAEQHLGPTHNDTATALNNFGLSLCCLARPGHPEDLIEAEQHLLRAVQVNYATPYPHYWLAKLYQKRGGTDGKDNERAEWERYLELGPTSEERRTETLARLRELATHELENTES